MTNICNFCLKLSNDCSSVDETLKKAIVELIFSNVEFVITDCTLICKECIQRLQSAFDLKAGSIHNEDLIASYETSKPRPEKLIDFYLQKNKMESVFPNDLKICRFCITVVGDDNLYLLEDIDGDMNLRDIITTHVPEVDFTITNNPLICKTCLKKLQDYGKFIDSWLDIYNLIKNYCISNKTDNPDLNEVRKFIFGINIGNDLDNFDIHSYIKNEIFTQKSDNGAEGNAKHQMEINEFKSSSEGEQIKTEPVSSPVQLRNGVTMNGDFEIKELKLKTKLNGKAESDEYFLKEEEISINDVMDADDSTDIEAYLERNLDTPSLCNSSSSEHEIPIEINNDNKIGSSFFRKPFSKMEDKSLSLAKKSIEQLMPSSNIAHQPIKTNSGFRCGLCPFQNQLEAQVKVHLEKYHYSRYNGLSLEKVVLEKNLHKLRKQLRVELSKCLYYDYKTEHNYSKWHVKTHSDEFPLNKCKHCDYTSESKGNLQTHLMVHYNVFFKCKHCDYKTKQICDLKMHLIQHSNDRNFYKCAHCDYKSKHKSNLRSHLLVHSNDFFKCEHCVFKTKYKQSLKVHLTVHHNESKIYTCEHCDYKTKIEYQLKQHLIVHSSDFYNCENCDYKTKHKSSLKTHVIVHSNHLYKCERCDYKTKNKRNLIAHMIVHSNDFYKCANCDYKTKIKSNLKTHLIVHSVKNKFYKCEHCDYKTKYKCTLTRHLVVHSNDFHKCEHCNFKTKHKQSLKLHSMGHFSQ